MKGARPLLIFGSRPPPPLILPHSERALAAIKVADADVAVVAAEFELPRAAADRALREAGGRLDECLRTLSAA